MPGLRRHGKTKGTCVRRAHGLSWCVPVACVFVLGPSTSGHPVVGEVFSQRQPDGTSVNVRTWGDEFYGVVESLDGYTLVRDPDSGATCYAWLSWDETS